MSCASVEDQFHREVLIIGIDVDGGFWGEQSKESTVGEADLFCIVVLLSSTSSTFLSVTGSLRETAFVPRLHSNHRFPRTILPQSGKFHLLLVL